MSPTSVSSLLSASFSSLRPDSYVSTGLKPSSSPIHHTSAPRAVPVSNSWRGMVFISSCVALRFQPTNARLPTSNVNSHPLVLVTHRHTHTEQSDAFPEPCHRVPSLTTTDVPYHPVPQSHSTPAVPPLMYILPISMGRSCPLSFPRMVHVLHTSAYHPTPATPRGRSDRLS